MNSYKLTVEFTSPERLTTWDFACDVTAGEFLKLALADVRKSNVTSFRLDRLDENGNPIAIPECRTVAELSIEDQAEIIGEQIGN